MEPVVTIVVPGLVGGLIIAVAMIRWQGRSAHHPRIAPVDDGLPQTDVINAARIRVAGVGGLGLVAMALAVAFGDPRIGLPLAAGCALGVVLAAALILHRRRSGSLTSSSQHPGAHTMLPLDSQPADDPEPGGRGLPLRALDVLPTARA